VTCVAGLLMALFFRLVNRKMPNATRNAWLLFLSPSNGGGGVPFNPPFDAAATVMVCPLLAATCVGCCGPDIGMYERVLPPGAVTVMGTFGGPDLDIDGPEGL